MMNMNKIVESRYSSNKEILEKLSILVEKHSDLRFHQMLQFLEISFPDTDQYYEESTETLNRMRRIIEEYKLI